MLPRTALSPPYAVHLAVRSGLFLAELQAAHAAAVAPLPPSPSVLLDARTSSSARCACRHAQAHGDGCLDGRCGRSKYMCNCASLDGRTAATRPGNATDVHEIDRARRRVQAVFASTGPQYTYQKDQKDREYLCVDTHKSLRQTFKVCKTQPCTLHFQLVIASTDRRSCTSRCARPPVHAGYGQLKYTTLTSTSIQSV